jgi:Tfp pilus assembly protein PilZ
MNKALLYSAVMLFLAMGATAQETERRLGEEGVFANAINRYNQIVVGDDIYALAKTLMIDGEQRLAGQVMDRLEDGERVRLEFSGETRDGYPVVTAIETSP